MPYNKSPKSSQYRDANYYTSGSWVCSKNPSRAHYWVISGTEAKCKYCLEVREIDSRGLMWTANSKKEVVNNADDNDN